MRTKAKSHFLLVFIVATFYSIIAQARPSELHVRTGGFWGKYTGPIENEVTVPGVLDIDYSIFTSNTTAVNFRSLVVIEFPKVKNYYNFAGVGLRFFTRGPAYEINTEEDGFNYQAMPKWRTYFGGELGLAQATVISYGNVLQTSSSLVMLHLNAGAIYRINSEIGISAQLNLGVGSGYSSVAVLTHNLMGLVGLCLFF